MVSLGSIVHIIYGTVNGFYWFFQYEIGFVMLIVFLVYQLLIDTIVLEDKIRIMDFIEYGIGNLFGMLVYFTFYMV